MARNHQLGAERAQISVCGISGFLTAPSGFVRNPLLSPIELPDLSIGSSFKNRPVRYVFPSLTGFGVKLISVIYWII
jgi:hypothetical protein